MKDQKVRRVEAKKRGIEKKKERRDSKTQRTKREERSIASWRSKLKLTS